MFPTVQSEIPLRHLLTNMAVVTDRCREVKQKR